MNKQKYRLKETVLGIPAPPRAYDSANYDQNCPFTGGLLVKKELLRGKVIKKDTNRSATIVWFRSNFVPKYERYEMKRSRLRVHNPLALNAQVGQQVLVARTRPLSKTKHHVVIKVFAAAVVDLKQVKTPRKAAGKKLSAAKEKKIEEYQHESS